jgi:endonuclease/exonuclease/phosphatase family metal-dependent hydrolase
LIDAIEVRTDVQGSARATIEQDVRFVAAMADTPLGAVLVSSLHLKCCGSSDGPEDLRRAGEAYAINSALRDIIAKQRPVTTVIAGDFNLVGSDRPMEIMRSGLDADRSDLLAAPALVWGDRARYTFRDIAGPFQPGALDYVVVGDASVEVARSFVLDTSLLSPGALRQMGLQDAQDGAVSDHLPTVVDLRPRPRAGK